MALIGRRNFGDPQVGLKYEQWNNTGTYGATVFGVADYDYGVATNPGIVTHLTFVSSEEMGTTTLYVDGAMQGSVASAISLSGLVGIGYGAQAEDGSDFFDDFDGAIYGVAIYDRALSLAEIRTDAEVKTPWRRTVDGWEHTSRWTPEAGARPPALHPVVVGLLEMLLALAALIGLSEDKRRPGGEKSA